jgi:hypothetical protein
MKRLMSAALLGGAIAMLPHPTPADAIPGGCLREAIDSCNRDFPGNDPYNISIRGYCYAIRSAICSLFD